MHHAEHISQDYLELVTCKAQHVLKAAATSQPLNKPFRPKTSC